MIKLIVLISGNGTNLQAIIDARHTGLAVDIQAVICNKPDAYGIVRAQKARIPTHVIPHTYYHSREEFDDVLQKKINCYNPDLIVLAGFMRKLTPHFVQHFKGKIINIHPSLLPKYPGLKTHERVLQAGDAKHGVSIHFVTDDLDAGPLIAQQSFFVEKDETVEHLKQRIQAIEHRLYPAVLKLFSEGRITLNNDQVLIDKKPTEPSA